MAELKKCSRCHSNIELKYYSINRKGEYYKCCDNCRNNKYNIECDCCGKTISKNGIWQHKKTHDCKQITYWKDKVDVNNPNINFFIYTDNTYHPYYIDTTELINIEGHNPALKEIETIRQKRKDEYFNYNI